MSTYSTQQTFNNLNRVGKNINLIVKANGGAVAVEKQVGADWVIVQTLTIDGGWLLCTDDQPTRITPTGGAVYDITT